ncbi:acyltransferase family protein [Planctomycetaceae bacterium SH139]
MPNIIGGNRQWFISAAWTLCYEEQFYAVTGFALALAARRLFLSLAAVTVMVLVLMCCTNLAGIQVRGFFFDGLWLEFAAGLGVYYLINHADGPAYAAGVAALVGGLLVSCFIANSNRHDWSKPSGGTYIIAFGFAILLLPLWRFDGVIAGNRLLRHVKLCGTMCYSLYLIHMPVMTVAVGIAVYNGITIREMNPWLVSPVLWILSLVAGAAFYISVERRFLNLPQSEHSAVMVNKGDPVSAFPISNSQ